MACLQYAYAFNPVDFYGFVSYSAKLAALAAQQNDNLIEAVRLQSLVSISPSFYGYRGCTCLQNYHSQLTQKPSGEPHQNHLHLSLHGRVLLSMRLWQCDCNTASGNLLFLTSQVMWDLVSYLASYMYPLLLHTAMAHDQCLTDVDPLVLKELLSWAVPAGAMFVNDHARGTTMNSHDRHDWAPCRSV